MIVTEAELSTEWASSDYLDKCRVVIFVRSTLAVEANARFCDKCELARARKDGLRPGTQTKIAKYFEVEDETCGRRIKKKWFFRNSDKKLS
jgi:hypothetical protein